MSHSCMLLLLSLITFCAFAAASEGAAWCRMPLARWTEGRSLEPAAAGQPPFGTWAEQNGVLVARGSADHWSTMLLPGDQGADARITVGFTVEASSGKKRELPGGCVRWGFHWGENLPGWEVALVLFWQDPLNFCRVQVSASRGELALWDAASGFLQLVPCAAAVGKPHLLEITAHGSHYQAALDGKPVLDYWNRSITHSGGQVGLGVWNSTVRCDRFEAAPLPADSTPMPPHRPNFRLEPAGGLGTGDGQGTADGVILFDGHEPISTFWQATSTSTKPGALYQEAVRLKPGWRSAYYTWIGPSINGKKLPLAAPLPGALTVEKQGEELVFRFRTEEPELARADHTCTVRYDAARGVYRYEYRARTRFTTDGPYRLDTFELADPLTYNNRTPGPEVIHRWNPAGHQWWVYQGPQGDWLRAPLIDYLAGYGNQVTRWASFQDFLYPDPVACPAFEITPGWAQTPNREFMLGLCHWGYDFHHTEKGPAIELPPGTEREHTITFTALPAAEAKEIFRRSAVSPKVARSTDRFAVFDPAGTTFAVESTRPEPTSTMIWGRGAPPFTEEPALTDRAVGRTDSHSLLLEGPDAAGVRVNQHVFEQWAKRWWVRGWFKSDSVRGRGLELRVKYAYAREPEDVFYIGGLGSREWTYFSFITEAPQKRDCTDLSFELDGPGRVWLDDIAFSAVAEGQEPQTTSFAAPRGLEPRTDLLIDLGMSERPSRAVYDESRNGHALYLDGPTWASEEGRGFLRFDGEDDAAWLPLKSVLEPRDRPPGVVAPETYKSIFRLDEFTYEVWVRPRAPAGANAGRMTVFRYLRYPQAYFDQLRNEPGQCRFVFENTLFQRQPFRLEQQVPYDRWLHVALAHGDGKVMLYLNGEQAGEVSYDQTAPGFGFFAYKWEYELGSFRRNRDWLTGDLGPFRLHTRALTAEEVRESYRRRW